MTTKEDGEETAPVASSQPVLHTDNVASFLDLQTEFIKRRDAAIAGKQAASTTSYAHRTTKNNILAISKEEKKSKMELTEQRTQRIRKNEEVLRKEEQERIKQKRILEQKAAIYERMANGEKLVYEGGKEAEFLVDFHAKKQELEREAQLQQQNQTGGGGTAPSSSSAGTDVHEQQRSFEPAPLIVHYDYSEDKGRVFGASHMPLPTGNEDAREERIRELKTMTEETHRKRAERKQRMNVEKAEERRRLNRLRKRMGKEPIPSSEEEGEAEEKEQQIDVADIPLPPVPSSSDEKATSSTGSAAEEKKPKYGVREWDRGKVGYMRWIEAQRDEREEEFAPPTFYFDEDRGGKRRKNK